MNFFVLYFLFVKATLTSFSGLASLPMVRNDFVVDRHLLTDHDLSMAVVAGRTGHLVRWRVTTGAGPGGYVQSLVFPSAVGSESLIIVRFAFDAGPDGPPVDGMDTITKGIRQIEDGSGGVGSSVGS